MTLDEFNSIVKSAFRDDISNVFLAQSAYHFAQTYEARLEALERLIDRVYDSLIQFRNFNDKQSEDELTIQIVQQLYILGVDATHATQNGGHCDILVKTRDGFTWIAEAKIYGGHSWTSKGFRQLSERYGVATYGKDHHELLIYCRRPNATKVLKEWMKQSTEDFEGIIIAEDMTDPLLHFRSVHKCKTSGLNFYVRHKILPLHRSPAS